MNTNKTYEDYENEYYKAIAGAEHGKYVVKKEIWISCKWQEDTDFKPWEKDEALKQILALHKRDRRLYDVVTCGIEEMAEALNKKKEKDN